MIRRITAATMVWLAAASLVMVVTDVVVAQTSATAPVTFYMAARGFVGGGAPPSAQPAWAPAGN